MITHLCNLLVHSFRQNLHKILVHCRDMFFRFFPFLLCLTFCCPASIFSLSPASCLVKWQQLCSSTLLKHSPIYVQKHAGFATNGFVYCINLIVVCCAPYSVEGEKYICYNFDSTHVTRLLKF